MDQIKLAIKREERYGALHYDRINVVIEKALGCYLFDIEGNKYLDCLAAYSAANLGHNHPSVSAALINSLSGNYASVISNVVHMKALGLFLEKVSTIVPQLGPRFAVAGNKTLPKNGGVESVETAIKMMRYYGWNWKEIPDGQQEIIVFDNSFHGRTTTIVSASTTEKYSRGFGGRSSLFKSVPFGDLTTVKAALTPNTCGILVEPYQGEGGMNIPPAGFLKGLREIADENDLILVFDEIQVGLGRTGKLFAFEHEGVIPDGLILGKALSGGLVPLSVFVTNAALMDLVFQPGSDGSTYGGYPLACIAGIAALGVLIEENLSARAEKMGNYLMSQLKSITAKSKIVKEIRGKGLFIGIELKNGNAMEICRKLPALGIIANDSHGHTIRISPPLIIQKKEIDFLCEQLEKIL